MAQNFLESSSVHGFKYLSSRFHWIERFFWIPWLTFSTVCTIFLIIELILKINNLPIVTYTSEPPFKTTDIDHPAVTVCSGLASRIFNNTHFYPRTKVNHGMFVPKTLEHDYYYQDFRLKHAKEDHEIVGDIPYYDFLLKLESGEVKAKDLNLRILKRLQVVDLVSRRGTFEKLNISVPTDNFLHTFNEFEKFSKTFDHDINLNWQGGTAVSQILNHHGMCYTFNLAMPDMLYHTENISSDFRHEYFTIAGSKAPDVVPRKNIGQFKFFPSSKQAFYDLIQNDVYEVHFLYLHDPYELPMRSTQYYPVHKAISMDLFVEPKGIAIDESLEGLEPKERNCYMEDEKKLKFFKVYTKTNCEHECLADLMINRCGCVEFFMIRNFTTRICTSNEKTCFDTVRFEFENQKEDCGCLMPCDYMKYDTTFKAQSVFKHPNTRNDALKHESICKIRMQTPNESYFVRKKQFNEVDFLSFVGGLLGLFAGFSAISFIEIIYWILKRIFLIVWRNRRSSVHPEIVQVVPVVNEIDHQESSVKNDLAIEYLAESSIHGFNYFFNSGTLQTCFWIFTVIFSMSCCVTLISQTRQKLPDSRVVMVDENLDSIKEIPFPVVALKPKEYAHKDYLTMPKFESKDPYENKKELDNNPELRSTFIKYYSRFQSISYGIEPIIYKIGIDPEDILIEMVHNSSKIGFIQQQSASLNGKYAVKFAELKYLNAYGYAFNVMDAEKMFYIDRVGDIMKYTRNITLKNNNQCIDVPDEKYPIHMNINDKMFEFRLSVGVETPKADFGAGFATYAAIHDTGTIFNFVDSNLAMYLQYGQKLIADVTPEIRVTDGSLRGLSPEERECYFQDENPLTYFRHYTADNCHTECISQAIFKVCKCIPYHHLYMNLPGMKYCHKIKEIQCAFKPRIYFANYTNACNCLPECNAVNYQIKYRGDVAEKGENEIEIVVRMKTEEAILYRKLQQFTNSDIISYVGGLLGLFAGISMLSIVEIFYFFIIRAAVNLWRSLRARRV